VNILHRFENLALALELGAAHFSTGATAALRVREALENPDCSLEEAVHLIQVEPLLSARIVAMANSVAFNRAAPPIHDVRTSLVRIGFSAVRTLAIAQVARQMADAPQEGPLRAMTDQLWEHTAHVAALARLLARRVTHQNPEAAFFAGIIHEITGFYLLSCARKDPELINQHSAEWVDAGEARIGRALVERLRIPDEIRNALEGLWAGYLSLPSESMSDTLILADELAPVPSPLREAFGTGSHTPQRARIEMAVGDETLTGILAEAAQEVGTLVQALRF
jgi:HD-like signal output (HDOD) protein